MRVCMFVCVHVFGSPRTRDKGYCVLHRGVLLGMDTIRGRMLCCVEMRWLITLFELFCSRYAMPSCCNPCCKCTAPRYDFGKKDEDNRPWIRDGQYATLDHTGRAWPGSA